MSQDQPSSSTPRRRLSDEHLEKLRVLFAEQEKNGATVFHQAHAEELLWLVEEAIAARSEKRSIKYVRMPIYDKRIGNGDDYAGDAWLRWTAVNQIPEDLDAETSTVK